ncbi:MAG: hypothetical protein RLZ22_1496 [Verrucomicrobiota bacterium]|jgi:hypothetical protein
MNLNTLCLLIPVMAAMALNGARAAEISTRIADPTPWSTGGGMLEQMVPSELKIKGGLNLALQVGTIYDSNFFLDETNSENETSFYASPLIEYISDPEGGAMSSFKASYGPSFRAYNENSDLNDVDHVGEVVWTLRGSRTELTLFGRYNELSGTDRLSGEFVNGSLFNGGVRLERRIASRTIGFLGASSAISDYSQSDYEGSEVNSVFLGGLWEATERTALGSSLRYSRVSGDGVPDINAWAWLLEARHRVGSRINLSASLGPEYAQDGDVDRLGVTGFFRATYNFAERWSWINSIRHALVPTSSSNNQLVDDLVVSTTLQRSLERGSIGGGLEYRYSEFVNVGPDADQRSDEQNAAFVLSWSRPFFSDRVTLDTSARYAFNSGRSDWEQFLFALALKSAF